MEPSIDIGLMSNIQQLNDTKYSQMGDDYLFSSFTASDINGVKGLEAPIRFDGINMAIIRRGTLRFEVNLIECEATEGQLVFFPPQSIVKILGMSPEGLECDMLFVANSFLSDLNIDMRVFKPSPRLRQLRPIFPLEGIDGQIVERYFELLHLHASKGPQQLQAQRAIARNLITSLLYQIYTMALERLPQTDDTQDEDAQRRQQGRQVNYVLDFIRLVQDNFHHQRSIAFYASRLFISPKYLSMVVKAQTGHTPSFIIDQHVLTEAKSMLLYSGKSIQQIANELSFANQSSFGKFFKNLTGRSPREYQKS